ncbi:Fic family protein [Roseivirga sp.]|uniref:Fic family protein n=1 Tax=Roseivirga sp. TaxID=1964215 RepID=UPI003B8B1775
MITEVYTFKIDLNWHLMRLVSQIDRFDASWSSIEKREGNSLRELKSIATIRSVGASTRIEGSKMSDKEVDVLLKNIDVSKLTDRDSQEVAGYFDVLDLISDSFKHIPLTENGIKNLHKTLLRYSEKDKWHRGDYKQHSNAVEAKLPDGNKQVIFRTPDPGFPTQDAMGDLVNWYKKDKDTPTLIKCALLAYEFVSIHPFQDGNGRMSRLLSTLALLKEGYNWIQYVSLEHEIEFQKNKYYQTLRSCQAQRPHEDITAWIHFFFNALIKVQNQLMKKLSRQGIMAGLSPREKAIITIISERPGTKSGEIAKRLEIPNPTVKRILGQLLEAKLIEKHGAGAGTNYTSL